jgi:hypothetical protein
MVDKAVNKTQEILKHGIALGKWNYEVRTLNVN